MLNIEDDTSSTSSTTPSVTDNTSKGENGHPHQVLYSICLNLPGKSFFGVQKQLVKFFPTFSLS